MGTFLDTDTCIRMLRGQTPISDRFFHLSFDDGFKNCRTNTAPVLLRMKVPAAFFLPTSLIGAGWETTRRYCPSTPLAFVGWSSCLPGMTSSSCVIKASRSGHTRAPIGDSPACRETRSSCATSWPG
jgi:hypothetical protein